MELSENISAYKTPCYVYNLQLLNRTLDAVTSISKKYSYNVHYALKANSNKTLLKPIAESGLGADCVSGNEILRALECGFDHSKIVFAGVGKSDKEINIALDNDIHCFNSESLAEIEVINDIAKEKGKIANIAIRVNPNIDAHTHSYITTGLEENKFGIYLPDLDKTVRATQSMSNVKLIGLHFHIGSQISDMNVFKTLCLKVNEITEDFRKKGINFSYINFGGGLGIKYEDPYQEPIAKFTEYFETFHKWFNKQEGQEVHFEPGRSIVAHCGDLISRVLFIKEGHNKKFAIIDAGMNDLIRPALYQAYHDIENISSKFAPELYDVVGPICETSDCFGKNVSLNACHRNDIIVIHSCGAYGEVMASQYNLRELLTIHYIF